MKYIQCAAIHQCHMLKAIPTVCAQRTAVVFSIYEVHCCDMSGCVYIRTYVHLSVCHTPLPKRTSSAASTLPPVASRACTHAASSTTPIPRNWASWCGRVHGVCCVGVGMCTVCVVWVWVCMCGAHVVGRNDMYTLYIMHTYIHSYYIIIKFV